MTGLQRLVLRALVFDALMIAFAWVVFVPMLLIGAAGLVGLVGWVVTWDERNSTKVWPRRIGPRDPR